MSVKNFRRKEANVPKKKKIHQCYHHRRHHRNTISAEILKVIMKAKISSKSAQTIEQNFNFDSSIRLLAVVFVLKREVTVVVWRYFSQLKTLSKISM